MTAMLGCDGCGAIASDRGDDPTRDWFALSVGPAVGGTVGPLPTIDFAAVAVDLGAVGEDDDSVLELDPVEPDRHFCSIECLRAWATRAAEAQPEATP